MRKILILSIVNILTFQFLANANENFLNDILNVYGNKYGRVKTITTFLGEENKTDYLISEYHEDGKIKKNQVKIYIGKGLQKIDVLYQYHGHDGIEIRISSSDYLFGFSAINFLAAYKETIGMQDVQKNIMYAFISDYEGRYLYYLVPFSYSLGKWWNEFNIIDANNWECITTNLSDESLTIKIKKTDKENMKSYFINSSIDNTSMALNMKHDKAGNIIELQYVDTKAHAVIFNTKYSYLSYDDNMNWIECIEEEAGFKRKLIRRIEYW
ncbi:MAG: hypothetical protein LBK44_00380 [Spirochaetales bacterium]|jgi:hypothetical protein|nr:hypothetical protein [Spirochaetales bacterium]